MKPDSQIAQPISSVVIKASILTTIFVNMAILFIVSIFLENTIYRLESDQMIEIVDNVSNHTTAILDKYMGVTTILSENTTIIRLLADSDQDNPMYLQPYAHEVVEELTRIRENFEGIVINFGIIDVEEDNFLTDQGGHSFEGFSFQERPYYSAIMNKEQVITSPYIDYFTGDLVLSVVSPVIVDGEVLGAVLLDLNVYFVAEMVEATNRGETGSSFIIDKDNMILAHQGVEYIGELLEVLDITGDNILEELESPTGNLVTYSSDGIETIGLIGTMGNYGWKMVNFMALDEFEQDIAYILRVLVLVLFFSSVITIFILYCVITYCLKPISEIKSAMGELASGNVKFTLQHESDTEIGDLADSVRTATKNLAEHIDQMQYQLDYDDLTGLFNLNKFMLETEKILKENPDKSYTILTFDVDNFKYITETYGFDASAKLIKEMGHTLRTNFKGNTPVARNGADVFLLLLDEKSMTLLDSEMKGTSHYFEADTEGVLGEYYELSFSLGIYRVQHREKEVAWMIDCASYARRIAKKTFGFSVEIYSDQMQQLRENSNKVTSIMKEAVEQQEFFMVYQPKVDVKTSLITGAEALVRWKHGDSMIFPNEFIPVFEHNGFIETLDYYVLDAVCAMIAKEQDTHDLPLISVNLSGITIIKKDVVEKICKICRKHGVLSSQIELEITESALVDHFDAAIARIEEFRVLGFAISMDDFGSGISSLGRLKNMPIDVLKIDREFIIDSFENKKAGTIVQQVVKMSKALGLKTVIEGVETLEQLEFVVDAGCDLVQGYLYAKPMETEDFLEKLKQGEIMLK
ncbi:MAG: EAL domain-containing protein [Eubacteriales bacterium]